MEKYKKDFLCPKCGYDYSTDTHSSSLAGSAMVNMIYAQDYIQRECLNCKYTERFLPLDSINN